MVAHLGRSRIYRGQLPFLPDPYRHIGDNGTPGKAGAKWLHLNTKTREYNDCNGQKSQSSISMVQPRNLLC